MVGILVSFWDGLFSGACMLVLGSVIFTPIPGEMIQFDEHMFQMGREKPPSSLESLDKCLGVLGIYCSEVAW